MGNSRSAGAYMAPLITLILGFALVTVLSGCPGTLDNVDLFLNDGAVATSSDAGALGNPDAVGPDPCDYVFADIISSNASCAAVGCHGGDTPSQDLDLVATTPAELINRLSDLPASQACAGEVLIDTANPENSLLYTKLLADFPCGISRMPIGFPLPDSDTACVLSWIENNLNADDPGVDAGVDADAGANAQLIYFEAEDAIVRGFTSRSDAGASNGMYVAQDGPINNADPQNPDNAEAGLLTFNFTLPQMGLTRFWARSRAATTENDSVYVRIDGGAWIVYNNIPSGGTEFAWDDVHDSGNNDIAIEETLTAGAHTLDIVFREADTQIDRILISQDQAFTPN